MAYIVSLWSFPSRVNTAAAAGWLAGHEASQPAISNFCKGHGGAIVAGPSNVVPFWVCHGFSLGYVV